MGDHPCQVRSRESVSISPDPFQELKVVPGLPLGGEHGAGDEVDGAAEAGGGQCGWDVMG